MGCRWCLDGPGRVRSGQDPADVWGPAHGGALRNPARRWLGAWHGILAPRVFFSYIRFRKADACLNATSGQKCLAIELDR